MFIICLILDLYWSSWLNRVCKSVTFLSQIIEKPIFSNNGLLKIINNIFLSSFKFGNSFLVRRTNSNRISSSMLTSSFYITQIILEVIHGILFCLLFPMVNSSCLLTSFLKVGHCSFVEIFVSIMKIVENAITVHNILQNMILPTVTDICFPLLTALLIYLSLSFLLVLFIEQPHIAHHVVVLFSGIDFVSCLMSLNCLS